MDTKKLRQKILDLAIRGKLVPQDPNDEPASVLLERIREKKERLIKEGKIKRSKKSASDTPHYENVPFEVPEGWEWIRLEDYLLLLSGQDYPPQKYNSEHRGIPYIIGASNIENEQLSINRWTDQPSVISTLNDVLVVCKGAGVGKIAMNNVGDVHIARQIQAIRDETEILYSKYIKLCIASNISDIIANDNGLIPGLKRELLLSLMIPIAPIEEQKRIVDAVEQWFTLIGVIENETSDLSVKIQQTKFRILDLAIHGKLVPQAPNDEPAIELLKRINPKFTPCDNAQYQYEVPENWAWCKLVDLCSFLSRGKSPKYSEDRKYPVFAQKCNLFDGDISLEQARFLDPATLSKWSEEYKLRDGDILVNSTGTGTVGRTRLFHSDCLGDYPFVVPDSHVSVIRTVDNIVSNYFYSILSSRYGQEYIEDNLAGSTNQKELYIGVLENLQIPLPPNEEQMRIADKIEELFAVLDEIQKSIEA